MFNRLFYYTFIALLLTTITLLGCKEKKALVSPIYKLSVQENYPCDDGIAADLYPCDNIGLFAHLSPEELGGIQVNDIWGWTDQQTGIEYALVGLYDGVSFVDISNPNEPVVVGKLNEAGSAAKLSPAGSRQAMPGNFFETGISDVAKNNTMGSIWRDVKVFNNFAFVVSDGQAIGMQIFDLSRLREYDGTFLEFSEDAFYDQLGNAHNIAINEQTGFAYVVGVTVAEQCGSTESTGLHIIDINSPLNPQFAGCFIDEETDLNSFPNIATGYIHDTQCVIYEGSDEAYRGKEICFSSAEGGLVITDVTNKSNTKTIGFSGLSDLQYAHQGWLTEDHRYFLMNDELDEINLDRNTKTYIWDVQDLGNPTFVGHYTHNTPSIDHNLYVRYNYVFQSNYTSGLRVLKTGNLSSAELIPVGYFDTQPQTQQAIFQGSWSNYPFFESGVIVISDIDAGLFILKPDF
jgi:choice-of-anchor B domain-containing protein